MIDLWTVYFEVMQEYLDGLLDILVACICQGKPIESSRRSRREKRDHSSLYLRKRKIADITENDTLARIGTSCFQQLLESNVRKLSPAKWESIVSAFVQLFTTTTAYQLFDPELHAEVEPDNMDEPDGES
jgi:brefeldin A-inhibited guanine nucleotide-exchange protein